MMSPFRFAAAATAASVLATAAMLAASCSGPELPDCALPTPSEVGVDGGPDPCHCDPPPSLNYLACECMSGNQGSVDEYNACMVLYRGELDAGAE